MTIPNECASWAKNDPVLLRYHDEEWCRPCRDEHLLFELLCLEGASTGLSWGTILHKRQAYREAFCGFDPLKCAALDDVYLESQLANPGIIRCRRKIFSVRRNAEAFLKTAAEKGSFYNYLWSFTGGTPISGGWAGLNQMPAKTVLSEKIAKDLKKRGFLFTGPVITYSYLQAAGIVNDHLASCPCFAEIAGFKAADSQ